MSAGNSHVFPVLGHGAAGDLDPLGLQYARDLLIGQGVRGIFFFNELLDTALEDEQ